MARGWESKAIESQQEEAERPRTPRPALTPEQRDREQHKRALELTRARTAADLTRATAPHHRAMLERALASLDEQLKSEG